MSNAVPSVSPSLSLSSAIASARNSGGSGVNLYEASRQWASRPADERFMTLDDMAAAVNKRRSRSRSENVSLNDIEVQEVGDDGLRLVTSNATVLEPTHWSFGQLCSRVGAPASYLRGLPTALVASNLRYNLRNADKEKLKLLTQETDHGMTETLSAVTGPDYGRIWDAQIVDALQQIVDRTNGAFFNPKDWSGKPSGLYASDHDCFAFMINGGSIVDGGGERDVLHRGFFVWNSETGAKSFGMKTFLFRFACGNHIVWNVEDVADYILIHAKGAPDKFIKDAMPRLMSFVNASAAPYEAQIKRAKEYLLPFTSTTGNPDAADLFEFGTKHNFTRPEIRGAFAAAREEEGQCVNLWDFVNGLTAHARGYDFVDSRVDLENRAGKLLALVN